MQIRELISFDVSRLNDTLEDYAVSNSSREVVIISTCNRTEVYGRDVGPQTIINWLLKSKRIDRSKIEPHIYQFEGERLFEHLFRLASGLNSMVLGETQILGQIKHSVRVAQESGVLGSSLSRLFDASFAASKEIRTKTDIGSGSVSLAAAALKVCRSIFGSVEGLNVVFVGAGEMNQLCAQYFSDQNISKMKFISRTLGKAEDLARQFKGNAYPLRALLEQASKSDVIVSCTSATTPIFHKSDLEEILKIRKNSPQLYIDLAVPRDVSEDVTSLGDIFVYTIDDLGHIVNQGRNGRLSASRDAERLIDLHVRDFLEKCERSEAAPLIRTFRARGEKLYNEELAKALKQLDKGDEPMEVISRSLRSLTNKFLHQPSNSLSRQIKLQNNEKYTLEDALRELHNLDE